MSGPPVSLVLAGIGGMGAVYVDELLNTAAAGRVAIQGVVDPLPERCPRLAELKAAGVPVFGDLSAFYAERSADLAVISSPIQFHAAQTILALERGSHVLCEKPVAATIQEARAMAEAERRTGRWTAIGYQWSFSRAVQELKSDIMTGVFGRPRRFRCLYTWPRDKAYYGRNDWAGRKRDSAGAWILDSPANNAMAHDLHNMLYLLGSEVRTCAKPIRVQAELYRANPIENYDTAAARIIAGDGTEILVWFSHASRLDRGPVLRLEFERGLITAEGRGKSLRSETADGSPKDYGCPDARPMKKLWDAVEAAENGSLPVCGVEASWGQTLAVDGMQDSAEEIVEFHESLRREEANTTSSRTWIEGLDDVFERCFEAAALPAEIGVPWAHPSLKLDLADYRVYPRPR